MRSAEVSDGAVAPVGRWLVPTLLALPWPIVVLRWADTVGGTAAGPLMASVAGVAVDGRLRDLFLELVVGEVTLVTPTVAERGVAEAGTVVGTNGGPGANVGLASGGAVFPGTGE